MAGYEDFSDDEALAKALQIEEEDRFCDKDRNEAHKLQERSREELKQADVIAAVRQQEQEQWRWQSLQREDTKFAKTLHNTEVAAQLQEEQDDEELAKQLQQLEEEDCEQQQHQCQTSDGATEQEQDPPQQQEPMDLEAADGQIDQDYRFAAELTDRDVAYQLQLQLDKQLAEDLARSTETTDDLTDPHNTPTSSWTRTSHQPSPVVQAAGPGPMPKVNARFTRGRGSTTRGQRGGGGRGGNRTRTPRQAGRGSATHADTSTDIPDPDDYEGNWELAERLGEVKDRSLKRSERGVLPVSTYKGASSGEPKDDCECKVCLSDFEKDELVQILPCLHKYHKPCIEKWFDMNSTCPICNLDVKEEVSKA